MAGRGAISAHIYLKQFYRIAPVVNVQTVDSHLRDPVRQPLVRIIHLNHFINHVNGVLTESESVTVSQIVKLEVWTTFGTSDKPRFREAPSHAFAPRIL